MIEKLRELGVVQPPEIRGDVATVLRSQLKSAVTFTGHVIPQGDMKPRTFDEAMAHPHGFCTHKMADVLSSPGLFTMILGFLPLAEEYFGEVARLYSVNAFWKKPSGAPGWHYDEDDRKQLVMFMFGTDVATESDGSHGYVLGSHKWDRAKLKPWHNVQEDVSGPLPSDWPVTSIYGPAGTIFITDTRGLHNGFAPKTTPRLLLWARFGVSNPPPTYYNDGLNPVPWHTVVSEKPDAFFQERTRLVVNWAG